MSTADINLTKRHEVRDAAAPEPVGVVESLTHLLMGTSVPHQSEKRQGLWPVASSGATPTQRCSCSVFVVVVERPDLDGGWNSSSDEDLVRHHLPAHVNVDQRKGEYCVLLQRTRNIAASPTVSMCPCGTQ